VSVRGSTPAKGILPAVKTSQHVTPKDHYKRSLKPKEQSLMNTPWDPG